MKLFIRFALIGVAATSLILYLLSTQRIHDTTVSGLKLRTQHWSGTIHVVDDVNVVPWKKLVIEPGTKILFEKNEEIPNTDWTKFADAYIKDHNDPTGRKGYGESHFHIFGKIIAVGTKAEPIVFTSAQSQPEYADWDQLIVLANSQLEYVEVAYAHNGINISGKNVVVTNSTIHDSLWSCVDIFAENATVQKNEIYHCWHQAIGVKKVRHATIRENQVHDAWLGVNCEYGSTPTIQQNSFGWSPNTPECPLGEGNENFLGSADTPGGTYNGVLVYPSH